MTEDLHDNEFRVLLQSVERDVTKTSDNREHIRRTVLAAFDEVITARDPGNGASDLVEGTDPVDVDHLIDVDEIPIVRPVGRRSWPRSSPRVIGWLAAAAAVVIALVLVRGSWDVTVSTEPAQTGSTDAARLAVTRTDETTVLVPGPQTTDAIAGGLSFDAPAGLAVIGQGDGFLVLGAVPELGDEGRLVIAEVEPSDWENELESLTESGDIVVEKVGVVVDGTATTRWDVNVTNEAINARSCLVAEPCLRISGWPDAGPAAVHAGIDTQIVELGRNDESIVMAITTVPRFAGPFSGLAVQVVNSVQLGD